MALPHVDDHTLYAMHYREHVSADQLTTLSTSMQAHNVQEHNVQE